MRKYIQRVSLLLLLTLGSCASIHVTGSVRADCLPDDSEAPVCKDFVDPVDKEPVFVQHAWNCSRYWECMPQGGHCLTECPEMSGGGNLYFNYSIPYPFGPVCDWPYNVNCTMGEPPSCNCQPWQTCNEVNVCTPDCQTDDHCSEGEYCSSGSCLAGCSTDSDCPGCSQCVGHTCSTVECCSNSDCTDPGKPVCTGNTCIAGCLTDDECPGCARCSNNVCKDLECCDNADCQDPDRPVCSANNCIAGCLSDADCLGYDQVCNEAHSNCQFCNNRTHQCQNGCVDTGNCKDTVCDENHICTVYLDSIILRTESCTGCEGASGTRVEDGPTVLLVGYVLNDAPNCLTPRLDHRDRIDYDIGRTAEFNTSDTLGDCYQADLNFGVSVGEITWTSSQGQWRPKKQQIELKWSNSLLDNTCCCLSQSAISSTSPKASLKRCLPCSQHPGCPST